MAESDRQELEGKKKPRKLREMHIADVEVEGLLIWSCRSEESERISYDGRNSS
jgi:hypothetical protein